MRLDDSDLPRVGFVCEGISDLASFPLQHIARDILPMLYPGRTVQIKNQADYDLYKDILDCVIVQSCRVFGGAKIVYDADRDRRHSLVCLGGDPHHLPVAFKTALEANPDLFLVQSEEKSRENLDGLYDGPMIPFMRLIPFVPGELSEVDVTKTKVVVPGAVKDACGRYVDRRWLGAKVEADGIGDSLRASNWGEHAKLSEKEYYQKLNEYGAMIVASLHGHPHMPYDLIKTAEGAMLGMLVIVQHTDNLFDMYGLVNGYNCMTFQTKEQALDIAKDFHDNPGKYETMRARGRQAVWDRMGPGPYSDTLKKYLPLRRDRLEGVTFVHCYKQSECPHRETAYRRTLAYNRVFYPGARTVVAYVGDRPRHLPEHVISVKVETIDGNFRRGLALNIGSIVAPDEVVVLCDTDLLLAPTTVVPAVRAVREGQFDYVIPFTEVRDLTEKQSDRIEELDIPWDADSTRVRKKPVGGAMVITKTMLETVGGYASHYIDWGTEDNDMFDRLRAADTRHMWSPGVALHMYHPVSAAWDENVPDPPCYLLNKGVRERSNMTYRAKDTFLYRLAVKQYESANTLITRCNHGTLDGMPIVSVHPLEFVEFAVQNFGSHPLLAHTAKAVSLYYNDMERADIGHNVMWDGLALLPSGDRVELLSKLHPLSAFQYQQGFVDRDTFIHESTMPERDSVFIPSEYQKQLENDYCDVVELDKAERWQIPVYDKLVELAGDEGLVADIGCGAAEKLVARFPKDRTIGVDLPPTVKKLRELHADRTWYDDMSTMPAMKFKAAVCADVIEHVPLPHKFLRDIRRHINAELIVFSTPERHSLVKRNGAPPMGPSQNKCHVQEWSLPELISLLDKYFHIVDAFVYREWTGYENNVVIVK